MLSDLNFETRFGILSSFLNFSSPPFVIICTFLFFDFPLLFISKMIFGRGQIGVFENTSYSMLFSMERCMGIASEP